ncbi:hypothetical protein AB0L86_04905 [Micromonospora musae]|uniref:hypothetical protein n=1 Tax=Micromonospora musae TaxID=1894970 RepID=UPI0034458BAC
MNYAGDDLTPLLAAQPATGTGFRQGVIRSWNAATAENTVEVDGVLLSDLPVLNTSEALLLAPGDVVGILTTGGAAGSWAILGRLTVPGTAAAASALSAIGTHAAEAITQRSTTSTSWVDLADGPSVTVDVRPSGRVLLSFAAQIGWAVIAPGAVSGMAGIAISGANSRPLTGTADTDMKVRAHIEAGGQTTNVGVFAVGSQKLLTGLNPGETTFTMRYMSVYGSRIDFDNRALSVVLL